MRTISSCSSCRGLPTRLHWTASGSSMKRAEWKVRIVVWWATPGATTLRPPDHPAMKCGSTRPVAMRKPASTKARSSLTGVRRLEVKPKSTCPASLRASWFTTLTVFVTQGSPTSSSSSAPRLGRCSPVAIRTVMPDAGIPAAIRSSIIGRRNRWLGTGRVMSQIRMQALSLPAASVFSGAAPVGRSSTARIAAFGSAIFGNGRLRITWASAAAGSVMPSWLRPKATSSFELVKATSPTYRRHAARGSRRRPRHSRCRY